MITSHHHNFLMYLLVSCSLMILIGSISMTYGQQQCPTTKTSSWPAGKTVNYKIGSNIGTGEQAQIRAAMGDWNTANTSNGSGVVFREVTGTTTAQLTIGTG